MRSLLPRLRYFVTDALDEWRHSPGVNLLATTTLAAVLFVAGLVLLVLANVSLQLDQWRRDVRVEVYLLDGITDEVRNDIRVRLEGRPEVSRIVFVGKDEALQRFRQSFGDELAGLPAELESNPLPASFEAYLAPGPDAAESARSLAVSLAGTDGVEEVRFDSDWLDRMDALLRLARFGGGVLSLLVLAAVVLVMASVLRLAVYARRDEIEIVQLVGATPGFVRGPFLVAGLAQGLVASLSAIGLVEVARRLVLSYADAGPGALLHLAAGHTLPFAFCLLLIVVGLAVSFAGSFFAVRQFT